MTKKQLREALKARQSSLKAAEEALKACQSSLEAAEEPTYLFIQMAESCTMRMEGNRTFFSTTDMDIDTYGESSVSAIMP